MQSGLAAVGRGAVRLAFPPQCLACDTLTDSDHGLCGPCRRDTVFAGGLVCDACGLPLPGVDEGRAEYCDDCLTGGRVWTRGRAALVYAGTGRKLVLALKHGDRLDLVRPLAAWMARAAQPILSDDMLVTPVPLHRWRLLRRRYNQAAALSRAMARIAGLDHVPDLLVRPRPTPSLDHRSRDDRHARMDGAIAPHPRHGSRMAGRRILLVDDVMTSGATLAAATAACRAAGAQSVDVVVLARVAKDG